MAIPNYSALTAPLPKPKKPKGFKYGPAPKFLVEAVRKQLRILIEQKNLDEVLGQIGRYCNQADDFLMTVKTPEAIMKGEHEIVLPGVMNEPSNVETYGATLIRELVTAYTNVEKNKSDNPGSLVTAIAQARMLGMSDVAAEMEKKLLGKSLDGERPVTGKHKTVEDYLEEASPPLLNGHTKKNGKKTVSP